MSDQMTRADHSSCAASPTALAYKSRGASNTSTRVERSQFFATHVAFRQNIKQFSATFQPSASPSRAFNRMIRRASFGRAAFVKFGCAKRMSSDQTLSFSGAPPPPPPPSRPARPFLIVTQWIWADRMARPTNVRFVDFPMSKPRSPRRSAVLLVVKRRSSCRRSRPASIPP